MAEDPAKIHSLRVTILEFIVLGTQLACALSNQVARR
jgi:hypothetical protein